MTDHKTSETNILVIGDSEDLPLLYDKLLHPRYTVHKASTDQQAMRLLRQSSLDFQLVLLDLVRPPSPTHGEDSPSAGMSGTAMLAFLRQHHPSTHILLMWAHSRSELQQCGLGHLAHTFPFLYKSGSRRAVLSAVEDVLLRPALTYEPIRGWELCAKEATVHAGGLPTGDRPAASHLATRYHPAEAASIGRAPCTISSRLTLFLLQLFHGLS